jgi:hypothetical protein
VEQGQNKAADKGGAGAAGGNGGETPWFDTIAEIKGDPALVKIAGGYKSPVDVVKALGAGWGPDWRETYAKDDKGKLGELQRYATPGAALDGLFAGKERLRAGEVLKPLPENANGQEVTEFRKLHGIPETPEGYLAGLPDGLVIGEEDKPVFESFAKALHAENVSPKVAHTAIKWYNNFVEESMAQQAEMDQQHKAGVEDALRAAWGKDYRPNIGAMNTYLDTLPGPVAEAMRSARDAEGRGLLNIPEVMQWLVGNAREFLSVSTLVGGDGQISAQTIDAELAEIQKIMGTPAYIKDEKKQARYRDLLDAKAKLEARGKSKAA